MLTHAYLSIPRVAVQPAKDAGTMLWHARIKLIRVDKVSGVA